jgi:hypothetical protein
MFQSFSCNNCCIASDSKLLFLYQEKCRYSLPLSWVHAGFAFHIGLFLDSEQEMPNKVMQMLLIKIAIFVALGLYASNENRKNIQATEHYHSQKQFHKVRC